MRLEYTDSLKVEPYNESNNSKPPVVLVDAVVGMAYRLYHSGSDEKIKEMNQSSMWTFRAPISEEEYDWKIIAMPSLLEM